MWIIREFRSFGPARSAFRSLHLLVLIPSSNTIEYHLNHRHRFALGLVLHFHPVFNALPPFCTMSQTPEVQLSAIDGIAPPPPSIQSADDAAGRRKSRKRRRLICFHCNRPEGHFVPYRGSWFYSFFVGMSFGLVNVFGPYRCQCCGKQRLMFKDWLNPMYHIRGFRHRAATRPRR